jgi:hypothetical protein
VGFWSVLRWRPASVTIESCTRRDAWALTLDAQLDHVEEATCTKRGRGTRVILRRPRNHRRSGDLAREIEKGLRRYCRYLRSIGRGFAPLPITCNGMVINEPLAVDGPVTLAFKSRDAEGVVGLGKEPRVELYARGLLVMTAAVLDELDPHKTVTAKSRRVGGVAPVVLINSNRLDVVLSRQAPLSSRHLRRLERLARARVDRLVSHVVDGVCPRPWTERLRDAFAHTWSAMSTGHAALAGAFGAMALIAAIFAFFGSVTPSAGLLPSTSRVRVVTVVSSAAEKGSTSGQADEAPSLGGAYAMTLPYTHLGQYSGATVEVPDAAVMPWGLNYWPRRDLFFRAHTLDLYDPVHGWLRGPEGPLRDHPSFSCRSGCLRARLLVVGSAEPLVIPIPTGYRLEPHTLRYQNSAVQQVFINDYGEALVKVPEASSGVLEYVAGPYAGGERPSAAPPDVILPASLERELARIARLPATKRVWRVARLVRERIIYDVSAATARAYREGDTDWLTRVLTLGAGDCDVKNGLNVLFLRRVGIPSRMAIGIAGYQGRARPHLHAWTEYFLRGWKSVDATGTAQSRTSPVDVAAQRVARPTVGLPAFAPLAPQKSEAASVGTEVAPVPVSARVPYATSQRQQAGSSPPAVSPAAHAGQASSPPVKDDGAPGRGQDFLTLAALLLSRPWPSGVGLLIILLTGALVVWVVWRHLHVREQVSARGGTKEQQRALASILHDALSHPEPWSKVSSLWRRRVLPTLKGPPLSVSEALRRAAEGVLYVTWSASGLARLAASCGAPVLDGTDKAFGGVIGTLGRTVNIDTFDRLRPAQSEQNGSVAMRIEAALEPVNELLERFGGHLRCCVCPALREAAVCDVDLSDIRLPAGAPWPRRYVAVNPSSREVLARVRLLLKSPSWGAFVWIDWLLDHSELLAPHASRLRERAALEALETWV